MSREHAGRFAHLLSERDRQVLAAGGHGQPVGWRSPCAVLVVDMTEDFIGDQPEEILESMKRFPLSCGAAGWRAAERVAGVLLAARAEGHPVIYTVREVDRALERSSFGRKRRLPAGTALSTAPGAEQLPALIAPEPADIVIPKAKPSAFFGTPLVEHLIALGTRQLVCCGVTTSGCVRASVVDAFSYGFTVAVPQDCTADRWETSHQMALFEMASKYGDVVDSAEVVRRFAAG